MCVSWAPAGLGCLLAFLPALGACLGLGCLPALGACLPWVPASLACSGARPPLDVCTTRGTVPLTAVTAQFDRIPSVFFELFWFRSGRISSGWRSQSQGRAGVRIGLQPGEISWLVHEHQVAWAGLGLHLNWYHIFWFLLGPARRRPASTALPSRAMCTQTFASWSLPRASLSLSSAVF